MEIRMSNGSIELLEKQWTQKVTQGLMHWACYQNILNYTNIPEGAIVYALQPLLKKYTNSHVTYNESYPNCITSLLKRSLYADLTICDNVNNNITRGIIEVKVESKNNNINKYNIFADICRLALFNQHTQEPAYLFLFGRKKYIKKLMVKNNSYPQMLPIIDIREKSNRDKILNNRINHINTRKLPKIYKDKLGEYLDVLKNNLCEGDIRIIKKAYKPGSDGLAAYLFKIEFKQE